MLTLAVVILLLFPSAVNTHSNLPAPGLAPIPENASFKGGVAGSPANGQQPRELDFKDISDAVSRLGFGDAGDSIFDDVTIGYKSAYQQAKEKGENVTKTRSYRGNTECGLPYIVDIWRDSNGRVRISLQIWCLSGDDFHTKLLARVSTSGKDFVLAFPMNPNMERGDHAFHSFIMNEAELNKFEQEALMYIVKNHPKAIARIQSVSKIKQRQQTAEGGRYHEQRIPLLRKVMHQFATELDGDAFFHGLKFVKYDDGSVHMHVELLGEQKDCYTPEERKQAPVTQVAKSPPLPTNVPVPMETGSVSGSHVGGATVLSNEFEPDASSPRRSSKRRSTGGDSPAQVAQQLPPPVQNVQQPALPQYIQALQQQAVQQALQQQAAQYAAQQQQHQHQHQQHQQFQPHPLMYQVDPNANSNVNNANANGGASVASMLSDADDSSFIVEDASSSSSSVSTLYEEETVASGLSAPANLNGQQPELAFASSLQLAAAKGQQPQQQQVYHAQ